MRIDLANADRVNAQVICENVPNRPGQIALDEAHGVAYMAEFIGPTGYPGIIYKINLTTGYSSWVMKGPVRARGLLVTSDGRFAYVSEDQNLRRFDLVAKTDVLIAGGSTKPC